MHHVPGHRLIANAESLLALRQPARRVLHDREGFWQNLVELRPLLQQVGNGGQLSFPSRSLSAEIVVGERLELLVQLIDALDQWRHALDFALIFRAKYFL